MPEPPQLKLRPTVINGNRTRNDYSVIWTSIEWGERHVGRIRLATEQSFRGTVWLYDVQPVTPIGSEGSGSTDSLKGAQARFRSAFERYCDGIGDLNRAFPAGRGRG